MRSGAVMSPVISSRARCWSSVSGHGSASRKRVVSSRGVALQLFADGKVYLRHGSGTLGVGALGARSYFKLG